MHINAKRNKIFVLFMILQILLGIKLNQCMRTIADLYSWSTTISQQTNINNKKKSTNRKSNTQACYHIISKKKKLFERKQERRR